MAGAGGARLRGVGVDKRAEELENDLLVDLLFQLLAGRVRSGSTSTGTVIVLGADRIRRETLERGLCVAGVSAAWSYSHGPSTQATRRMFVYRQC